MSGVLGVIAGVRQGAGQLGNVEEENKNMPSLLASVDFVRLLEFQSSDIPVYRRHCLIARIFLHRLCKMRRQANKSNAPFQKNIEFV